MNEENQNIGKRERDVVRLLMQGKGNNQIAHELGVSVRTVEYHLGRVYAKLNVASRAEAILKLSRHNPWEIESATNAPSDEPLDNFAEDGDPLPETTAGLAASLQVDPPRRGALPWMLAMLVLLLLLIVAALLAIGTLFPSWLPVKTQLATVLVPQVERETQLVTVEVPVVVPQIVNQVATVEVTRIVREIVIVTPFAPDPASLFVARGVDLSLARTMHTATLLADGRILLAGGSNGVDNMTAQVELFDPLSGNLTTASSLNMGRHDHTATRLQDSRVLVVGGYNPQESPEGTAEVYDPATNTWTLLQTLYAHGVQHTSTLLADGRVLVVGGCGAGTCIGEAELFDPFSNTFTPAAHVDAPAASHVAVLLEDGRVLAAGGTLPDGGALLYDPSTNAWTPTGPMLSQHAQAAGIKMVDGRVLIAGGITISDTPAVLTSVEIYDPSTDTWSPAADLSQPRYAHHLALLPGGAQVAAVGGASVYDFASAPWNPETFNQHIELYDPHTNQWMVAGELPLPVTYAEISLLPDGRLWVSGGGASRDTALAWATTWLLAPLSP